MIAEIEGAGVKMVFVSEVVDEKSLAARHSADGSDRGRGGGESARIPPVEHPEVVGPGIHAGGLGPWGPPVYEIHSSANSPILTISLQKVTLPQGSREISIEDQIIRKVKVDPGEKILPKSFSFFASRRGGKSSS